MEDIGYAEDLRRLQYCAAEQGETLGIVVIVTQRSTVEGFAIEIRRVVNEIELHSRAYAAVKYRTEAVPVIEWDRDAGDDFARILQLGLFVTRKKDGDLVPQISERERQGTDDVCQPASLGKRHALGCREGDMHETSRRSGCKSRGTQLRNGNFTRKVKELAKQLSLIAESKEGQRGQDRVKKFCCAQNQQTQTKIGSA